MSTAMKIETIHRRDYVKLEKEERLEFCRKVNDSDAVSREIHVVSTEEWGVFVSKSDYEFLRRNSNIGNLLTKWNVVREVEGGKYDTLVLSRCSLSNKTFMARVNHEQDFERPSYTRSCEKHGDLIFNFGGESIQGMLVMDEEKMTDQEKAVAVEMKMTEGSKIP